MAKRILTKSVTHDKLQWRVNTPRMLREILECNTQMTIFRQPFNILQGILAELAERASQLNDDELNAIMIRLALYAEGDPFSDGYKGPDVAEKVMAKGLKAKQKRIRDGKV